jgi:hypothetical protein
MAEVAANRPRTLVIIGHGGDSGVMGATNKHGLLITKLARSVQDSAPTVTEVVIIWWDRM